MLTQLFQVHKCDCCFRMWMLKAWSLCMSDSSEASTWWLPAELCGPHKKMSNMLFCVIRKSSVSQMDYVRTRSSNMVPWRIRTRIFLVARRRTWCVVCLWFLTKVCVRVLCLVVLDKAVEGVRGVRARQPLGSEGFVDLVLNQRSVRDI